MLKAYLAFLRDEGDHLATIHSANIQRTVNFRLMQQRRADTGRVRQIRIRCCVPGQCETPTKSLLQQGNQLADFYVQVSDPTILANVQELLQSTGHSQNCSCLKQARVKSLHRIEHFRLWQGYRTRLAALRQEHASCNASVTATALVSDGFENVMESKQETLNCGEALAADVNEKILLHGTTWEKANSIVLTGFDHRTCHRAMYGAGVYFASDSCKSHQYTCRLLTFMRETCRRTNYQLDSCWNRSYSIQMRQISCKPKGLAVELILLLFQFHSVTIKTSESSHLSGHVRNPSHTHGCCCAVERTLIIARVALGDVYLAAETRRQERRPPERSATSGTYDSIVVNPGPVTGRGSSVDSRVMKGSKDLSKMSFCIVLLCHAFHVF